MINSSKIIKNGLQIVKNENFQQHFFRSFYVIASLHAKHFVYSSNGVTCGQYKDKEEKNSEKKWKKVLKTSKMKNSEKRKKNFLPIAIN